MSLTIKVKTDFNPARALINGFSDRRLRTTIAIALTKTAKIAQKEVVAAIGSQFDRPTKYALGATRLIPATKDTLFASVWLKDRQSKVVSKASHFLYSQTFGGRRERKAYETALLRAGVLRSNEFTVPAEGYPLNAHGNVPIGVIRQILSQLKAAEISSGYTANKTDSKRSKAAVKRAGTYFVPPPDSGLPRGIWQHRIGSRRRMVLKIVVGQPRYRQRLRMFEIGQRVVDREFNREFEAAAAASRARM